MKVAEDQQNIYADKHKTYKEFQIRENVYLRVKPKRNSLRTRKCANLAPRYYGPFEILQRIGTIVCRPALPPLVRFHDVFHVSLLKKYVQYFNHVID